MTNDESNFLTDYSEFLDNSGNHLTYSALSVYQNFADELSKKEKFFFNTHLAGCKICTERLQEVADIEDKETKKQTAVILGISPSIFRYAIAAVLVAAVGLALVVITQDFQQNTIASNEIAIDKPLAAATSDPAKFIPNQVLENFIERTVRSTQNVSLLAPAAGETLSTPYTITWQGSKKIYTLTVVNNKNADVWKKTTSSFEIVLDSKLDAGLYYLKLEVNEKLVQVRKFVVIR